MKFTMESPSQPSIFRTSNTSNPDLHVCKRESESDDVCRYTDLQLTPACVLRIFYLWSNGQPVQWLFIIFITIHSGNVYEEFKKEESDGVKVNNFYDQKCILMILVHCIC